MNRTTAIFLALGILLAHSLSIHRDYQWHFAGAFDQVQVAFALGENAAQGDGLRLSTHPESPGLQAYPSPLWVALSWATSLLGGSPARSAQMAGLLASLLLISLSTRIAYNRVAGVIPPLLLVLSGTMACGAVCGTEHAAFALFAVLAFVAFEKGHPRWFALALALCVATRAEGLILTVLWFAFWGTDRIKHRVKGKSKRSYPVWVFAPAAVLTLGLCLYIPPGESLGLYPGVFASGIEHAFPKQGILHLRDFLIVAISPALILIGVLFLFLRMLSGAGIRALLLSLGWTAWIVYAGGDSLPFGLAYLPVMPLMALAIQETIVAALDTYKPSMEAASWVTLFITAFASVSASKFPGDVGPLSLQGPHARWLRSKAVAPLGEDIILGRTQLHSEIRHSYYMRLIAEFLDQNAPKNLSVLSPWVGHLSYHTDLQIEDWFTRLQSKPNRPKRTFAGNTLNARLDYALASKPGLVLPGLAFGITMEESSMLWGLNPRLLSMAPKREGVRKTVRDTLRDEYRLLSLPIRHPGTPLAQPYFVYSRNDLSLPPQLAWETSAGELHLNLSYPGISQEGDNKQALPQMVDLTVQVTDPSGRVFYVTPSGVLVESKATAMNDAQRHLSNVILTNKSNRRTRMMTLDLGTPHLSGSTLSAQIFHSGVSTAHPLAPVSPPLTHQLP